MVGTSATDTFRLVTTNPLADYHSYQPREGVLEFTTNFVSAPVGLEVLDSSDQTVVDNDTNTLNEGTEGRYKIKLSSEPSEAVFVSLTSNDSRMFSVTIDLDFPCRNYNQLQEFTVSSVFDGIVDGNKTAAISKLCQASEYRHSYPDAEHYFSW